MLYAQLYTPTASTSHCPTLAKQKYKQRKSRKEASITHIFIKSIKSHTLQMIEKQI